MVRNLSVVGAALALFISGLVDAQAADRASCEQYARTAYLKACKGQ